VNALELTVIRPAGSKGMYVMIAGMDGKPVATVGAIPSVAPDGATRRDTPVKHPDLLPVYNPSFEEGGDFPADWILGLQEGAGTFKAALDPAVAAHGTESLRMESDGEISASAIQRLVVEGGATYEQQAAIRTEGFSEKVDRAWVMLFAGSPITSGGFVKTEIVESSVKGWVKFRVPWKADRRQVYIGCLFKAGRGGRVWFDSVSLVKVGGFPGSGPGFYLILLPADRRGPDAGGAGFPRRRRRCRLPRRCPPRRSRARATRGRTPSARAAGVRRGSPDWRRRRRSCSCSGARAT
jgi:hypothetical protein